MWIVEVNFAGHRFMHEFAYDIPGPARTGRRLGTRVIGWRPSRIRLPRAA